MGVQDRDWYRDMLARRTAIDAALYGARASGRASAWRWRVLAVVTLLALLAWSAYGYLGWKYLSPPPSPPAEPRPSPETLERQLTSPEPAPAAPVSWSRLPRAASAPLRAPPPAVAPRGPSASAEEQAWSRFYVTPEHCKVDWSMQCANGYIKARRAFEASRPRQ
jgi:hypothetical protein